MIHNKVTDTLKQGRFHIMALIFISVLYVYCRLVSIIINTIDHICAAVTILLEKHATQQGNTRDVCTTNVVQIGLSSMFFFI